MDVDNAFTAFCLDRACGEFGRAVENALHEVEGKTKKEVAVKSDRVLRKWLDMPLQYRDPATSGHAPVKAGGM